jgi:hypothetical protein
MKYALSMLVLIAVLVPSAWAAGQARDPRVPKLQSQIRQLQASVGALQGWKACFKKIVPISAYGSETAGYVYLYGPNDLGTTSALDIPPQNEQPGAWVAEVDPSCVQSTRAFRTEGARKSAPLNAVPYRQALR